MVVAKIKFGEIAVKMLRSAVLVDAIHAALEGREETFNRVRAGLAPDVFVLTVIDGHVFRQRLGDLPVHAGFVSGKTSLGGDVLAERLLDTVEHLAADMEGTDVAIPLDQREDDILVTPTTPLLTERLAP